ncbi:MAG TPA: tetratricopeptide repeat protein [Gemmatimonadaceae bacterium]|jgi:tetratricopeptide (TPR) repeat protein|nr:tetratricopeptide repeat protein [Gemmatimonadaceae bacterium]
MSVSDDIRRWSDELARSPASMVFLPLGEALRTRGQIDVALRVALRGLERHPYDADAHDLLARIYVDRGETERALDEWDAALRCTPGHAGALKGMGFVCFNQGRVVDAERYLAEAAAASPEDDGLGMALLRVREQIANANRTSPSANADGANSATPAPEPESEPAAASAPTPVTNGNGHGATTNDVRAESAFAEGDAHFGDPRLLFADLIGVADQAALLLDEDGLVMAGQYVVSDGMDVGAEVGAALSGISDEARRAMRHLPLGDWRTIIFETPAATVVMTPAPQDGLVLVAAAPEVPSGLVRRALESVSQRAKRWMEQLS